MIKSHDESPMLPPAIHLAKEIPPKKEEEIIEEIEGGLMAD